MDNNLFRKESLDNISSPEQLNDYIKVSNPSIWLLVGALCILVAAFMSWCFIGDLPTTVDKAAIVFNEEVTCYLSNEDAMKVREGMPVTIGNGLSGTVKSVASLPLSAKEVDDIIKSDYVYQYLGVSDWNIRVIITPSEKITKDELTNVSITTDTVKPIAFLFNNENK